MVFISHQHPFKQAALITVSCVQTTNGHTRCFFLVCQGSKWEEGGRGNVLKLVLNTRSCFCYLNLLLKLWTNLCLYFFLLHGRYKQYVGARRRWLWQMGVCWTPEERVLHHRPFSNGQLLTWALLLCVCRWRCDDGGHRQVSGAPGP